MRTSPIRARLRTLRRSAAKPRRGGFRIRNRLVVAALDPPGGAVRVRVQRPGADDAASVRAPVRRLAFVVGRRRFAASLSRATGSLELRVSRLQTAVPARPAEAPPPPVPPAVPPIVAEATPLRRPPPPEPPAASEPPPNAPRRRPLVWAGAIAVALAVAAAGGAAALLLTGGHTTEAAAPPTTVRVMTTAPKAPTKVTTALRTHVKAAPAAHTARPSTSTHTAPPGTTAVLGTTHATAKPAPPPPSGRVVRWESIDGARYYWFQLLRQGHLGRVTVLERWPSQPSYAMPSPSRLPAGTYYWSAAAEARRGAKVLSSAGSHAGRLQVTSDGRLVRLS